MIRTLFMFHIWFSKPSSNSASLLTKSRALYTIVKLCVIHGFFKNSIAFNLLKKNLGILIEIQRWQRPTYLFVVIINHILVMNINVIHVDEVESTCMFFGTGMGLHLFCCSRKNQNHFQDAKTKLTLDFISLVYHACL